MSNDNARLISVNRNVQSKCDHTTGAYPTPSNKHSREATCARCPLRISSRTSAYCHEPDQANATMSPRQPSMSPTRSFCCEADQEQRGSSHRLGRISKPMTRCLEVASPSILPMPGVHLSNTLFEIKSLPGIGAGITEEQQPLLPRESRIDVCSLCLES